MKKIAILFVIQAILMSTGANAQDTQPAQALGIYCFSVTYDTIDCTMSLDTTQNTYYMSMNGREYCPSNNRNSILYGSGYIYQGVARIGLTKVNRFKLTDPHNAYIELDLESGSGTLYYEKNDTGLQTTEVALIPCDG